MVTGDIHYLLQEFVQEVVSINADEVGSTETENVKPIEDGALSHQAYQIL